MNDTDLHIEELRRRAKDNKAHNVEFFMSLSFSSLEHIRNLLITLSIFGIGAVNNNFIKYENNFVGFFLYTSIVLGLISYIYHFLSTSKEADYYAMKEAILSVAFPTAQEYQEMIKNESEISKEPAISARIKSLNFLIAQALALLAAIFPLSIH